MKTPMQELIEQLKEQAQFIRDDDCAQDKFYRTGLRNAIKYAESMLEKEKDVMCQFQSDGQRTDFWVKYKDNDDCFDKTFNTKEK
jgi:hypothetical protein